MSAPRVLVTGATGTVGAEVVRRLRQTEAVPVLAARDPSAARERLGRELEAVRFDFHDPDTHGPAARDADRLFLVRPPAISRVGRWITPAIDAAVRAGVRRVVFLSVLGAERSPLIPHRRIERHLEGLPVTRTFLRASFFMQNLSTTHRDEIRDRGEIAVPAGDGETSFVDARDVAAVASSTLTESGHENQAYDLTGPRALGYDEAAQILSSVLDREIEYTDPSPLAFARRMRGRGRPWGFVAVTTILYTLARLGLADRVTEDVRRVLGRPPTPFRRFAEDYRACWTDQAPAESTR